MSSGDNIELREKVARELFGAFEVAGLAVELTGCTLVEAEVDLAAIADRILALPKIAEALAISDGFPENDFRDYLLKRGRWAKRTDEMGYV